MIKRFISIILSAVLLFSMFTATLTVEASAKNTVKTSITKIESKANGFKVTWKKKSKIKGYQIQYSTSSKFKKSSTKTKLVTNAKTITATISKLKGCNVKYYVRVRTYKTSNGKKIYSSWSKSKTITTLKHKYSKATYTTPKTCNYCKKTSGKPLQTQTVTTPTSNTVYTTKTGKKYHSTKNCRGLSNAKEIYTSTLSAAKSIGLGPCSFCH